MFYHNLEKGPYQATLKPETKAKILVGCVTPSGALREPGRTFGYWRAGGHYGDWKPVLSSRKDKRKVRQTAIIMRSQSATRTHQSRFAIIKKGCGGDQHEVATDKPCQTILHSFRSLSLLDDRHVTGTHI